MSDSVHTVCPFKIVYGFLPNVISPLDSAKEIIKPNPTNLDITNYVKILETF